MPYINLGNIRDEAVVISTDHFGLNYVADYERIGDKPWERYDETVAAIGTQNLRYPGGSLSETYFDLRNPNKSEFVAIDGSIRQIEPLRDFLSYCQEIQGEATVIIPTKVTLTDANYGSRGFDELWSQEIYNFVYETLTATGGENIHMFEIGNEYESYMTSSEYGKVASRLAEIIQDAIDDFSSDKNLNASWTEPLIAVQTWSLNVQGSLTLEEQSLRNQAVMEQFSPAQIQAVDAIVSHYYHDNNRYLGLPNEQSYDNLEDAVVESVEMLQDWKDRFGRDFEILYTEWNTFHGSDDLLGLAQLPAVIGLFDAMTGNGVDGMHFWSAQYHASSLALNNGTLTPVGTLVSLMHDELIGFQPIEITSDLESVELAGFARDDDLLLFMSSTSGLENTVLLDDRANFLGYEITGARTIAVDASEADREYRNLTDLETYMEPDLPGLIFDISVTDEFGNGQQMITMSPYQTVVLTLEKFETTISQATTGDDLFNLDLEIGKFVGAEGFDFVSASDGSAGQLIDLIDDRAPDGTAMFDSIEGLTGSAFDDTLRGNNVDNVLEGYAGDDVLTGRNGNDTINGGDGSDFIYGGSGNDVLDGGPGNDTIFGQSNDDIIRAGVGDDRVYAGDGDDRIIYEGGQDTIDGEAGTDILDFSTISGDVSVFQNDSIAEVLGGTISFVGIEEFVFGAGDDRLATHWEGAIVGNMGAGNDFVQAIGDANLILLGAGDDLVYNEGTGNKIHGGPGDDSFFSYFGSMMASGGEGDDFFFLNDGGDTLAFSSGDGEDRVRNFDLSSDKLALDVELLGIINSGDYSVFSSGDVSTLDFGGSLGSISFLDLSAEDVLLAATRAVEIQAIEFF